MTQLKLLISTFQINGWRCARWYHATRKQHAHSQVSSKLTYFEIILQEQVLTTMKREIKITIGIMAISELY